MHSSCAHDRLSESEPVLHDGDRQSGGVAMNDGDEDDQGRRADEEGDQPFLEMVEKLQHGSSRRATRVSRAQKRHCDGSRRSGVARALHGSGLEAGFLVDRLDQVLADAAFRFPCAPTTSAFFHAAFSSARQRDDLRSCPTCAPLRASRRFPSSRCRWRTWSHPSSRLRASCGCRRAGRPRTSC